MTQPTAPDAPPGGDAVSSADESPPAHRQPSFVAKADALIRGKSQPVHEASGPVVEDLRAVAAEQDELRRQLQKVSETAQQAQSALMQAQGKADALLQVLYRLEVPAQ